nr:NAD(P)H-dependent oxidoreductase subunit E [Hyphomicrobiales bacterium]
MSALKSTDLNSSLRRDVTQPKGRQVDEASLAEISSALGEMPKRRDLLIEALHVLQDRFGCLRASHLRALAELFRLSQAEIFEVASFYHHFDIVKEDEEAPAPITLRICNSLSCAMAGADDLISEMQNTADPARIRIQPVPCIGRCAGAPAANVGKRAIEQATPEKLKLAAKLPLTPEIPDYLTLHHYRAAGGYSVLATILSGEITRESAIGQMSSAGLRGLGGAGFPAGRKWSIVSGFPGPRLMTVNGDEGEPGTFKDRHWLETDPHRMLEGALIAAHVVGCDRIYIYMRDEYPAILEILKREIAALETTGLSAHAPIEQRRGAGAYICGEESAMIESIEGKRGLPRHRPPYIAETGLFGRPTLNHNVETLAWVPDILRNGPDWFASQGKNGHQGLRSFSVSGRVKRPGVKIAAAGTTVRELIDEHCGGMADGHTFKAFLPGGASGGVFPASMAGLPLDFGTYEKH